jgi:Patatin-like phospholipase
MFDSWERRLFFLSITTIVWALAMHIEAIGIESANFQRPLSCSYFVGNPIADAQLAPDKECFGEVVAQGNKRILPQNAQALRTNTHMDFAFIALYWGVMVCFARVDWRGWSPVLIGLVSVAAVFDGLENWRILSCARELLGSGTVQGMLPRDFSLVKWVAFGLALVVLGAGRWFCEPGFYRRILPLALFAAGAMTLGGLLEAKWLGYASIGYGAALVLGVLRFWPWSYQQTLVGIEYAYLMRFQLLGAGILAAALPTFYRVVPSIFTGLFDARGFWSFAFIAWAAFQLAWTIMVTVRLVLVYGPDRFASTRMSADGIAPTGPPPVGAGTVVAFGMLAVPLLIVLSFGSEFQQYRHAGGMKLLAAVLGLGAAIGLLALTARLHFAIEEDTRHSAELVFPSFGLLTRKGQISGWALWTWVGKRLARLPADLMPGILDGPRLRSGHEMAGLALLVFAAVYLAVGVAFWPTLVSPEHQPAAMFFLLLLLTVFTWLLPGAAFFLDRTRLPVFTTLLVVSLLTGFVRTDHQYQVKEKGLRAVQALRPTDVVHYWEHGPRGKEKGNAPIIVVSTAGGGIRAAAWTAEVITRLQEKCQQVSDSLVLVSSVSGGSVGSMFVVGPYDGGGKYPTNLEAIRSNASRSSLSAVGWGMAYPDLARTSPLAGVFIPETRDRGWSLENAWATAWREAHQDTPTMRQWRVDVTNGTRPAVIFNATVSENGDRFLVASTDTTSPGTKRFFELYPNADIGVATAARLSATFPYVSPLARASDEPINKGFHIGDGGYYDNSGLLSVVEWLEQAAPALGDHQVVLILIDAKPGNEADGQAWSWQRQMVGPIETLLEVRTSSQQLRDSIELSMAKEYLENRSVKMSPAPFLFESSLPVPLSWHLTDSQIAEVRNSWGYGRNPDSQKIVYQALGCENSRQ